MEQFSGIRFFDTTTWCPESNGSYHYADVLELFCPQCKLFNPRPQSRVTDVVTAIQASKQDEPEVINLTGSPTPPPVDRQVQISVGQSTNNTSRMTDFLKALVSARPQNSTTVRAPVAPPAITIPGATTHIKLGNGDLDRQKSIILHPVKKEPLYKKREELNFNIHIWWLTDDSMNSQAERIWSRPQLGSGFFVLKDVNGPMPSNPLIWLQSKLSQMLENDQFKRYILPCPINQKGRKIYGTWRIAKRFEKQVPAWTFLSEIEKTLEIKDWCQRTFTTRTRESLMESDIYLCFIQEETAIGKKNNTKSSSVFSDSKSGNSDSEIKTKAPRRKKGKNIDSDLDVRLNNSVIASNNGYEEPIDPFDDLDIDAIVDLPIEQDPIIQSFRSLSSSSSAIKTEPFSSRTELITLIPSPKITPQRDLQEKEEQLIKQERTTENGVQIKLESGTKIKKEPVTPSKRAVRLLPTFNQVLSDNLDKILAPTTPKTPNLNGKSHKRTISKIELPTESTSTRALYSDRITRSRARNDSPDSLFGETMNTSLELLNSIIQVKKEK